MRVQVSTLNQYSFCPRGVYLSKILKLKPEFSPERSRGLISHAVRKELSIRQSKLLSRVQDIEDLDSALVEELDKILGETPYIYVDLLGETEYDIHIPELRSEILNEIGLIGKKLRLMVEDMGLENALRTITPWRVEYTVRSKKLGLSGRIDKVMRNPSYTPVEIKTSSIPEGIWEGDRLQTCAYAMLLEYKLRLREPILFGFVEYTKAQEKRPVMTTEKLRRRVIETRDEIIDIFNGEVPEICPHGSGKKCQGCCYRDKCYDI
jgi:CRISPR-associated protein Cas4